MLISRYADRTWIWQAGIPAALGVALIVAAEVGDRPWLALVALVPLAFAALAFSFYRDPERLDPEVGELALISPADGVVTDVGVVDEPEYLRGRALRVGIFLSPLNVHVNRIPAAGEVETVVHRPGLCLAATGPACIEQNTSTLVGLRTEAGVRIGIRQVTGALARTIVCRARPGDRFARGDRYGMIKLGSRTELLVPEQAGFVPAVAPGDVVVGGLSVLGHLPAPADVADRVPAGRQTAL